MANTTLTKEYFEKVIGSFSKSVDKRFKEQNKDLKGHVTKEVGELAAMQAREFRRVDERFNNVDRKLDIITSKVDNHEKRLTRVEKAIGMLETI